ncbi:MAG: methyltransferase domain-containing protein [Dehalococcoidia bacterium]|nr:methyltransferase domain-containing protein [Dehalococcoidia bacterium]
MQSDASPASATVWDAAQYDSAFSIVTRLGAGVLALLDVQPGERVVDLGCGSGHHTAELTAAGARAIGVDASETMIARARALYPDVPFVVARAETFTVAEPVDAVFSNAALHWMPAADAVASAVFQALRPGGRFVAEMGGQHNVQTIVRALRAALTEAGVPEDAIPNPWYFPSVATYAAVLERAGFAIDLMQHFARPTPIDESPNGLADWIVMFASDYLNAAPAAARERVIARAVELARPTLLRDGRWFVDYYRLRFSARRPAAS